MRLNFILNCNQFNKKKTLNRSVKEIKPKLNVFVYTAFELVFGIFKHFNKKQ